MSAALITSWAGTGAVVGAALAGYSRRLLTSIPPGLLAARLAVPVLTAIAFGSLAWRFGDQFAVLPYSYLAAVGVPLGFVDAIEQRLPNVLVLPGFGVLGVMFATSAIFDSNGSSLIRAVAGMVILAAFYLVLAVASRGGLGAGDVKLAGLLGLALGWQSWPVLVIATFLGWFTAALAWLILCVARWRRRNSVLPMGPFLLAAGLATIIVT
jgi:leader peptidase (prepilin peptidase)/N-methyltransferase